MLDSMRREKREDDALGEKNMQEIEHY